ncbi:hypothetical protein BCU68_15945 [Vibrio sp. 10N.286.49.B3]|uniref:DUF4382 domain-containing protein n=1 Tax=Vibrio sp. 10N.286.49.B3 TaxID=1880855 RepID=UPI000C821C77|nr:DUF4382 domain-containing protein [Vibrio sp. 10N.286.49.B3]PMH40861.1 hypothetical protein BCU68_15945 [Vibrio sp. 10N.286.49.B3]
MLYKKCSIYLLPFILIGCGGSGSDDAEDKTARVSFSVSDAPVDDADEVVIAFDAIELKHQNGKSYQISVVDTDEEKDYQQVDLLEYQGTDAKLIASDEEIAVGTYKEMILHIKAGNLNWVEANGTHDLKIPSNKLQLGGFEVTDESVQSFTIEFDLRKGLVLRGNSGNNNGYILKPHGVSIIDNGSAASLKGNVDLPLFTSGEGCETGLGNFVYLYQGHNHSDSVLLDNVDFDDEEYNDAVALPEFYVTPYASTEVAENGDYAFGYLPSGDYTVAFSCSAENDDPVQYDQLVIANPAEQVTEIVLPSTKEVIHDFKEVVN